MYELKKALGRRIERQVKANFDKQVDFLADLVKTKSINPGDGVKSGARIEVEIAKLIRKKLQELELKPRYLRARKGRPNVQVVWGAMRARKSMLLVGNMDTAEGDDIGEDVLGVKKRGRMYGRGVLDMKASLSAYLFAVQAIRDLGLELEGKLKMAFVVDGKASKPSKVGLAYLLSKGLRAKSALLGKPGTKKIAIGHRGGYQFKLTTFGESVNTGRKAWEEGKRGKNAIVQMFRAVRALGDFDLPYKPARAFVGRRPVFTFPTKIEGGGSLNVVPDKCEAWGDVRLMPGNTDKQIKMWMEDKLMEVPGLEWELEEVMYVPSMEIDRNDHLVQSVYRQSMEVLDKPPKLEGCGPWNDAWMLTEKDVPCIAGFGPDGGEDEKGEWVDLESLRKITAIYARVIVDFLGEKK